MANLFEQAINSNDGHRAAKIIQDALGIDSDDVANYVFPKTWPAVRRRPRRCFTACFCCRRGSGELPRLSGDGGHYAVAMLQNSANRCPIDGQ